MSTSKNVSLHLAGLMALLSFPAHATVQIVSMTPSRRPPVVIGSTVTWTVTATDSSPGPLTFQFNVARPNGPFAMVRDFNVGTLSAGVWTAQPFVWVPTGVEGLYQVQVVIKDFATGETASRIVPFQISALVTGGAPIVVGTANPLVALFSAPSCPSGSSMRVIFQQQSKATPGSATNWVACRPPTTMSFQIAGMYPGTAYDMYAQTSTGGKITNGSTVTFTTRALPPNIPFPKFKVNTPPGSQTDTATGMILYNLVQLGGGMHYPDVATDLSGNLIWYYYSGDQTDLITRPLAGGMLMMQSGPGWNPASEQGQVLRQIDLAGTIIRETNTGVVQQQLLDMGAANGGPCDTLPKPAPIGAGCLGAFHHDAIQFSINGVQYTAVIADVEKIYPPGTQGDTSGLPVDVIGDMIIVMNGNWQVVWYFDTFEHAGAPELDINRAAVLGGTCVMGQTGCPPVFLLGSGIAPQAKDWLHANTIYFWPKDGSLLFSLRNQDWVVKINYNRGLGNGNILWKMGPDGDFTFHNIYNDSWPWYSGQHDSGIEGNGLMTVFDNGNTRVSPPPVGSGSGYSRGMALSVDEANHQVTPVLSADLGVYSAAMGAAQLLSNGNYFFVPGIVMITINLMDSYGIEIHPNPGSATGAQVLNILAPEAYRSWRMAGFYFPPGT